MGKIKKMLSFAKPAYHLAKRALKKIKGYGKRKEQKLVFVFQDLVQDFGIELYENDLEIKDTIRQCNTLLVEMGGPAILPYFEKTADEDFFGNELTSARFVAIQLAIAKSLIDRGFFPNAVLSSSSGVFAAAYAAGALTLEDALRLSLGLFKIGQATSGKYEHLFVSTGMEAARQLCDECPFWIEIICHYGPEDVIICCKQTQKKYVKAFLDAKAVKWKQAAFGNALTPYHTPGLRAYQDEFVAFTEGITSKPLKCDFYFDGIGKVIPQNSIIGTDVWFNIAWKPSLLADTLQEVLRNDLLTFVQIGYPIIDKGVLARLNQIKNITAINTVERDATQIKNLNAVYKKLSSLKFQKQLPFYKDETGILNDFLESFNTENLNPFSALDYLRKQGSVHFLPRQNKWLILGYDNIEFILKNYGTFSSIFYQPLDPYLMGAEPRAHKMARTLLQPMFSAKILEGLSGSTKIKTSQLLNGLFFKENFDLIKDFAEPLTAYVIFKFLGFTEEEVIEIENIAGSKSAAGVGSRNLVDVFEDALNQPNQRQKDTVIYAIKSFLKDGTMTFDDAKSVLAIFLSAGVTATTTSICAVIHHLLTSPQVASKLISDNKLIPQFITEVLRVASPASCVFRTTTTATELGGKHIPAGSLLILSLESANRDSEHFSNSNRFLLGRPTKRNFSFGASVHQCIGMSLSKAILNEVVTASLERADEFKSYNISEPAYFQAEAGELRFIAELKFSKIKRKYALLVATMGK